MYSSSVHLYAFWFWQGYIKYVVRPVLSSGCEKEAERCACTGSGGPLNLGGYGVELALKNMEYKALDDSEVKKGYFLSIYISQN
jgi:UDP-glucose:glycoprotein glucosyltransferase